jgi:hypothetical protein
MLLALLPANAKRQVPSLLGKPACQILRQACQICQVLFRDRM